MPDRSPQDGKPYYCLFCAAGYQEYIACEWPNCQLESEETAQARAASGSDEPPPAPSQPEAPHRQAIIAFAVEAVCNRGFAEMEAGALTGLKLAVMMRMGISAPITLAAAALGDRPVGGLEFQKLVIAAGFLMQDPEQQTILSRVEHRAWELVKHHAQLELA